MRSLRLMTFVCVVLFLEFSQCQDAEKSAILFNFSKPRSIEIKGLQNLLEGTKISMQCCFLDYSATFRYGEITVLIFSVMFPTCTPVR